MNSSGATDGPVPSYSVLEKIDLICDQFELELRRGGLPKIETYLTMVEDAWRLRLLRDLVAIDFEFSPLDLEVAFADYGHRFPDAIEMLLSLKKEFELSPRKSEITPPSTPNDPTILAKPTPQIGRFKLLHIAGVGGFGTVWRATDLHLQRDVAVKIPRIERTTRGDLSVFMREARFAAKLKHPNIVTVHEVGEDNGKTFIVTDFIDGKNLKDWKKDHAISPQDAARLVAKIAVAIHHAHSHGVIHRDLKLANVMMDSTAEPHVTDFGLAKRESRDDSIAVHGRVMGTPAYMAPEQARADHEQTDRRTDIYSLGVILYELLTGTTPYHGDVPDMLHQILSVPPAPPRDIKPEIPRDLEAICLKCLAKESVKRYESAQALADDLHLFLNGETLRGIPAPLSNRVWKWFRRNRRSIATLSLVILFVSLLSAGLMAWRNRGAKPLVPVWPVSLVTDPPGCEITAVAIDPQTGEPDPSKIQKARGRTPLTMSLAGGDYLIVAEFDSKRFHEVYRHVPEPGESIPFGYRVLRWKKNTSGVIELPTIRIPRPDITLGMGFCEGAEQLEEPDNSPSSQPHVWRIPAFYVSRSEMSREEALNLVSNQQESLLKDDKSGYGLAIFYWAAILAEEDGMRLPNTAELFYLSEVVCPRTDNGTDSCTLKDGRVIQGLHSGTWEWTSTKPGGPFSSSAPVPEILGLTGVSRMIGGGDSVQGDDVNANGTPVGRALRVKRIIEFEGLRGVRSVAPRTSPKDFMHRVDVGSK